MELSREQVAAALDLAIDATVARARLPRLSLAEVSGLTSLNTTAQLLGLTGVSGRINELLWRDHQAAQAMGGMDPAKLTGYLIARGCQGYGGR